MDKSLSEAAEDYGRAFCVPPNQKNAPWDQLTPNEQSCIIQVGNRWDEDVIRKLAGSDPIVAVPEVHRVHIKGPTGKDIGTVTFADGVVTACWGPEGTDGARSCRVLGYGKDAYEAAKHTLGMTGFQVTGS